MKIILGEIFAAKVPVTKLLNQDLPLKASYRLSKLVDQLNEEYNRINDMQKKTMIKHGSQEGEQIKVDDDKIEEYREEFNEFLKEEIEINFEPLPVEVLGEEARLSAMEMKALSAFFIE